MSWSIEERIGEFRPLVHCKDCIWSRPDTSDHEYRLPLWCDRLDVDKYEGGFCDWGERRVDDASVD